MLPVCCPRWRAASPFRQRDNLVCRQNRGTESDGTRTRDLRRDRPLRMHLRQTTIRLELGHLQGFLAHSSDHPAWLRRSCERRLGHEWATRRPRLNVLTECLRRQWGGLRALLLPELISPIDPLTWILERLGNAVTSHPWQALAPALPSSSQSWACGGSKPWAPRALPRHPRPGHFYACRRCLAFGPAAGA